MPGTGLIDDIYRDLKCKEAKLPMVYLGIPLSANLRKECIWRLVLEKIDSV